MFASDSSRLAFRKCHVSFLAVGAIVCVCGTTVDYFWIVPQAQIPFVVDNAARDLGSLEVGHHELVYDFRNPDVRPRRIIGLCEGCDLNCCFRSKHRGQVTLQPGGTFSYKCDLHVRGPGKFAATMTIYLEDNGLRKVELPISGIGIPTSELSDVLGDGAVEEDQ